MEKSFTLSTILSNNILFLLTLYIIYITVIYCLFTFPGYAIWGLVGITSMAILRFLAGIFMGGEYTSANPLAMEYSPKKQRGLIGGIINAGFPTGTIIVSVVFITIGALLGSETKDVNF